MPTVQGIQTGAKLVPLFKERLRFALRHASRQQMVAQYHLANSDIAVHLRHATPDIDVFTQLFLDGHNYMPEQAKRILNGLNRPIEIVDLGANIGGFGAAMLKQFPTAHVISVEPDPGNLAILRETVAVNQAKYRWDLIEACAGIENSTVQFVSHDFALSRVATTEKELAQAIAVDTVDVFSQLGNVDFLKIDIEGAEWPILSDSRFESISARVVVLEYHLAQSPVKNNNREFAAELLTKAGFSVDPQNYEQLPNGHGVLWAWRN